MEDSPVLAWGDLGQDCLILETISYSGHNGVFHIASGFPPPQSVWISHKSHMILAVLQYP